MTRLCRKRVLALCCM